MATNTNRNVYFHHVSTVLLVPADVDAARHENNPLGRCRCTSSAHSAVPIVRVVYAAFYISTPARPIILSAFGRTIPSSTSSEFLSSGRDGIVMNMVKDLLKESQMCVRVNRGIGALFAEVQVKRERWRAGGQNWRASVLVPTSCDALVAV